MRPPDAADLDHRIHSVGDVEMHALVPPCRARPDERAEGPRDPSLAADHLADVVGGDVEADDGDPLALAALDADLVGIVDEAARQLLDQALAQGCSFRRTAATGGP
ncbi:MAG TPA: hypothetical protein VLB86_08615 [Gaiellaceae bacterium]|nr:hypothetical protein [Gaiellaceae bacterium]